MALLKGSKILDHAKLLSNTAVSSIELLICYMMEITLGFQDAAMGLFAVRSSLKEPFSLWMKHIKHK